MRQLAGQFAVIGQQQQAFAGPVQPAHGIDARTHSLNKVHHCGAALRIGHRGYVPLGLVEQQIDVALRALQQLAVYLDMVAFNVGFAAELSNGLAVHTHATLRDKLFGLAPGRNPRGGDDLLQSLRRHSQPPVLSEAICPATCSSALSCSGSDDTVGSVTFSGTSALSSSICSTPPSSPGVPVASARAP